LAIATTREENSKHVKQRANMVDPEVVLDRGVVFMYSLTRFGYTVVCFVLLAAGWYSTIRATCKKKGNATLNDMADTTNDAGVVELPPNHRPPTNNPLWDVESQDPPQVDPVRDFLLTHDW
jgi:hypothetical protein